MLRCLGRRTGPRNRLKGVSFQRTFWPSTVIADPPVIQPTAQEKDWKKLPSDQKSNATFSLLPLIQYYEYTQDKVFLKTKLYPAMRELDEFSRDFAVAVPTERPGYSNIVRPTKVEMMLIQIST